MLTWDEAAPIGCAIPAPPPGLDRAVVDTLRHHGTGRATGLDSPRGVAARAALAGAIGSGDAARLVEAASGLLGLGEGLTPAGDDCLVGALAVRTTAVGREFVVHALAGRFSEPMLALLRARGPIEAAEAVRRLAGLGATSGMDTLAGLRLACLAAA